jgi:hypothetical protein
MTRRNLSRHCLEHIGLFGILRVQALSMTLQDLPKTFAVIDCRAVGNGELWVSKKRTFKLHPRLSFK